MNKRAYAIAAALSLNGAVALAGPGKTIVTGKDAVSGSCLAKVGKEIASCMSDANMPKAMLKGARNGCNGTKSGKGKTASKSEWRDDPSCPAENLLGSCATGDPAKYSMTMYFYKWTGSKLKTEADGKSPCEKSGGRWSTPQPLLPQ